MSPSASDAATPALAALLRRVPGTALHTMQRTARDPEGVQRRLLRRLLHRAADTEWGRRFGFAELARAPDVVAAYQGRVPLHDYEAYRADVERMRRGVADVTWPGRFRHFAVSSGTASAGKIIPVSHEMLVKNRRFSLGVGLTYLAQTGRGGFLAGKHLTVPGRIEADARYPGTLVGEVSGLLATYTPAWLKPLHQAVPNDVLFLPHWERKLEAIVERTVRQDVRLVVMVPSWAIVLFPRVVARYNALHGAQATTLREVWPNLQLYVSGGVALASYRHLLEAQVGGGMDFVETYGASEGFFAYQDRLDDPAMRLHLEGGVFYEFVRMDALGQPAPRRYTIGEVEPGVRYALFVTTCSGLYGYGVGDVVRFTETAPPRLVVAGRTSEMIDKYGEAVFGEEARAALQAACAATGAHVRDYHVAPRPAELSRLPAHQWLIEFDTPPASLQALAAAIDDHLQAVNRHYQIRREARAFDPPEIVALPPGTFYHWLQQTRTHVSGQTKVPRMSEERALAESVLAAAGTIAAPSA